AEEFGAWFGLALEGAFEPGARLTGRRTAPGCGHETIDFAIERVEPEHLLAYRWRPASLEPGADSSDEPMTLVEFHLAEVAEGCRLTVIESGFDRFPPERRASALRLHTQGWTDVLARLAGHVSP